MRKVFTAILIIMLLVAMCVTLIACDIDEPGLVDPPIVDPNPPVPPDPEDPIIPPIEPEIPVDPSIRYWDTDKLLNQIINSFDFGDKGVANFDFTSDDMVVNSKDEQGNIKTNYYYALIRGNITQEAADMEFYVAIKDRATDISTFGLIVTGGKLYIEVGDLKLNIENIDTGWLIDIVTRVAPELLPLIDGLLSGLGLTIEDIFNSFIKGWLFTSTPDVRLVEDVYQISFDLDVYNLLSSVFNLINGVDLDGLLAGLGVVLPGDLNLNNIISDISRLIPKFGIEVRTEIRTLGYSDEGVELVENLGMGFSFYDENDMETTKANFAFDFYDTAQDLRIPDGLASYDPFSITQLRMDFYLGADIQNLDVGELIAMFAGKELLPKDTIVVNAKAGITLKLQIDINLKDNDDNLALIELYSGNGSADKSKRLAGIYFMNNVIKINVSNLVPGIYKGKNVALPLGEGITLTGEGGILTGLLDTLKAAIDGAIDGFAPKLDNTENNNGENANLTPKHYNNGNYIVSVMLDESGMADTNTGSVLSFINSIIAMLGFADNIILENETGITVNINQQLFDVIKTFITDETIKETIDGIAKMIGEITLNVAMTDFNVLGIDNIGIKWNQSENLAIELMVSNFLIGFQDKELKDNIAAATDGDYVSSLQEILYGALKGVDLQGNMKLRLPGGQFGLIELLKELGVPTDAIPLDELVLNLPPEGLVLDISVVLQMHFDPNDIENSVLKLELYNNSELLMFKEGMLLGLYAKGGKVYLDIPGISIGGYRIPRASHNLDIFTMLKNLIDEKIDINLELDKILGDLINGGETTKMSDGPTLSDIIGVTINEETFKLTMTSIALARLLEQFDITLKIPYMDMSLEVNEWNSAKLHLGMLLGDDASIEFDLAFTKIQLGGAVDIVLPEDLDAEGAYQESLNDFMAAAIDELLAGISMDAKLDLTLPGGIFPIGQMLAGLGVPGVPDIQLEVGGNELGNDVVLNLELRLRMNYVADNPDTKDLDESVASRFLLELELKETVMGLKPGILIGVYGKDGKTYLDLSGFRIGELILPRLSLDINIPKLIGEMIPEIDIEAVLPDILKTTTMSDDKEPASPDDYPIITINKNGLAVALTANAISSILEAAGSKITGLPAFDARVEIDLIEGFHLEINECKLVEMDLLINNIGLGSQVNFILPDIEDTDYPTSITHMLKDTIAKVMNGTQLRMNLKIEAEPMDIMADDLFAMFGINFGTETNKTIISIKEKTVLDLEILLKMEYDITRPQDCKLALKIYLKNDFFLQQGGGKDGLLIALYANASGGEVQLYVDLSGIKIDNVSLPKIKLNIDIMDIILKAIENINLDDAFEGVIGGITGGGEETKSEGVEKLLMNVVDDNVDNIQPPLPTLYVYQNALAFKIVSKTLMEMLGAFGVTFELPFEFDLTADLKLGEEYALNGLTILINSRNNESAEQQFNFNAKLFIGDFVIGKPGLFTDADEMPTADDTEYKSTISDALRQAANDFLNGSTMTAEFELNVKKKTYYMNEFLNRFVDTSLLPNLVLDIQHDQKLGMKLDLKVKSQGTDMANKGISLDIYVSSLPLFLKDFVYDPTKPFISIIGDSDGKTYLDMSNMVLSAYTSSDGKKHGYRLPKICIDVDILKIIDEQLSTLSSLDQMIEDLINGLGIGDVEEPTPKTTPTADATVEGDFEAILNRYFDLGITDKRVDLKVASQAIKAILNVAGITIDLPPIELEGSIDLSEGTQDAPNGLKLDVRIYDFDKIISDESLLMSARLNITNLRFGLGEKTTVRTLTAEEKATYSPTINAALEGALDNILSGTHIEANINLTLPAGEYDVTELLGAFGIDAGIIPVTLPKVKFSSAIVIAARLTLLVENYDPSNSANNKYIIKLTIMEDLIPYETTNADGTPAKSAIIKAGTDIFKLFGIGDKRTYIDLSGLTLANISLPRLFIDMDMLETLGKLIAAQDVDKLIKDLLTPKNNGDVGSGDIEEPSTDNMTDYDFDDDSVIQFPINVEFTEKAIKLQATSKALMTMLSSFGVSLPLPDVLSFDIVGEMNGLGVYDPDSNLSLQIKVDKLDSLTGIEWVEGEYFGTFSFDLNKVNFGDGATIPEEEMNNLKDSAKAIVNETGDKLKFAIYDLLKTLDLQFSARLNIAETKLNLTNLINKLLASSNQHIDIPIDINTDNLDQTVHFDIKWNLDFKKHSNSEAVIMMYTDSGIFEVKIIYKTNTLYVDLSRLGLLKFKVSDFNLTALIDTILTENISVLNTDITNVINGLLFPNNNIGDLTGTGSGNTENKSALGYMDRVGNESFISGVVNATENPIDLMSLLSKIMGELSIADFIIDLGINADLVNEILGNVGVGLGVPISVDGQVNIPDGAISLDLGLNTSRVQLDIKLVKIGGHRRYIDWTYFTERFITRLENPTRLPEKDLATQALPSALLADFTDYGEYSLISGFDLAMSILQSLKSTEDPKNGAPGSPMVLTINSTMNNKANKHGANPAGMKISIQRLLDYQTNVGGLGRYTAGQGSILLTLFKNHLMQEAVAYFVVDPVHRRAQVIGTEYLFNALGVAKGDLVNIEIGLDIAGTLGGLFDPLVKMIPNGVYKGGVDTTPTADLINKITATPMADDWTSHIMDGIDPSKLDINKILTQINLDVLNSGQIKFRADLEATELSDMLSQLLHNLLMNLQLPDLVGHNNPLGMNYLGTRDTEWGFFDELWNKLLKPLVGHVVSSALPGLMDLVKPQIFDNIKRILPIPRFDFIQVSGDLLGGKMSHLFIETRRKKGGESYDPKNLPNFNTGGAWEGEALSWEIYNRTVEKEIEWSSPVRDHRDWRKQSTNIIYDPYNGGDLSQQFNTEARRYRNESERMNGEAKSSVTWQVRDKSGNYSNMSAQPSSSSAFNNLFLTDTGFKNNYGTFDPITGGHVYQVRASADKYTEFVGGAPQNITLPVKVTILPKGQIDSIKDVLIAPHGILPGEVVANVTVPDGKGGTMLTTRLIKTEIKNAGKKTPYEEGETIEGNPDNPTASSHVTIDGTNYNMNVTYMSSKAMTYGKNVVIDAYSKNDFTKTLPDRVYFAYEGGAYGSSKVQWNSSDLDNLTEEQWRDGTGDTPLKMTAKLLDEINVTQGGDSRQVLEFEVSILSTRPTAVKFEGELSDNVFTFDPFEIINAYTDRDTKGMYPQTATITYEDGHSDIRDITLEGANLDIEHLYNMITPEGTSATDMEITVRNTLGDITWSMPIKIAIGRRVPKYIVFGKDSEGNDIKTLRVNPYEAMLNGVDKLLPTKANVVYEQNKVYEQDLRWDTSNFELTPDGGTFMVPVTVAPDTKLESKLIIQVIIERIEIVGLALKDNMMVFDYAPEVVYGGAKKEDFLPKNIDVVTADGNIISVPAVMDYSRVNVDINGNNNGRAVATIGTGDYTQKFEFQVVVPTPKLIGVEKGYERLWLNIEDIRNGMGYPETYKFVFEHYNNTTITKELPVFKWDDSQVTTIVRKTMVIDNKEYDVEVPGPGGTLQVMLGNREEESLPIRLSIGQFANKLVSNSIVLKYAEGTPFVLPSTLPMEVTTLKIDKASGAKTEYKYVRDDYPVDWITDGFNIFNGGIATAVVMQGSSFENRFAITVKTTQDVAPNRFALASKQDLTMTYDEYVTNGNKKLPSALQWQLKTADLSGIISTYTLPVQWDIKNINFSTANVVNGVATFAVTTYFNHNVLGGTEKVAASINITITGIPQLNDSNKTKAFNHKDYIADPSALFLSKMDMVVFKDGVAVATTYDIRWDLAALRTALDENAHSTNPAAIVTAKVEVIINYNTVYELRYTVDVTVMNIVG